MRHAWLIIAHNEFEILQRLVSALDAPENDFYIHFDKKVRTIPVIHVGKGRLFILPVRYDVRWGDYSQIAVELTLMEYASANNTYDYYHILSGTHLPIKSLSEINAFFESHRGKEILHLWPTDKRDIDNKLQRFNLFVRGFTSRFSCIRYASQGLWRCIQKFQKILRIRRFPSELFQKSDNWVSLTDSAVRYLVDHTEEIHKKYRFSYCGDEYFVATELCNRRDRFQIFDCAILKVDFERYNPKVYTIEDFDDLKSSPCLFARKFSEKNMDIVDCLIPLNHGE